MSTPDLYPEGGSYPDEMGRFIYGDGSTSVAVDDRTLAHLQLAITVKLRRNESFVFTLGPEYTRSGQGSYTLWMAGPVPVIFEFRNQRAPRAINPAWVEALIAQASQPDGLHIIAEPDVPVRDPGSPIDSAPE